jgi:hypothetical protein
MWKIEFELAPITCHRGKTVVWRVYECAADRFMRDAVYYRAAESVSSCRRGGVALS